MRVKIIGRWWEFRFCTNEEMEASGHADDDGYCSDPRDASPTIGVRRGLGIERTLDVVIHECLHAAAWHYRTEEEIEAEATDLAAVIMSIATVEFNDV